MQATLLVNGIVTTLPLQITALSKLVIVGGGLTETFTVCGVPGQVPRVEVGVTVYVTVCVEVELFVIVLLKGLPVCKVVLSPVVFKLSEAIQVYEDAKLLVSGILTVPPLQIEAEAGLVIVGGGTTKTVKVCGVPAHP